MEALVSRGSKKLAERAAADILKRWPTDVKSLLFLAKACFEQDAMRKALKYFDLARHAEPFNANVRKEMVSCLLFSARRRLDKGKLEMARRDYEHAEALSNSGQPDSTLYCKWAALEWRAGNAERAEALFAKALVGEVGALPVYYRMAIEAARAPAPAEVRDRVEKRLAQEWNSEPRAGDAAELVDVDSAHSDLGIRYPGRDVHVRELARYLERACGAVTFAEEQLLSICSYLNDGSEWGMLEAYAQKASEQCPGNYYFPLYLGRAQA
jgi:tetratricopeptide (TPR) repeat protein